MDDCSCNRLLQASADFTDQPYGTVGGITAGLLSAVLFHLILLRPGEKSRLANHPGFSAGERPRHPPGFPYPSYPDKSRRQWNGNTRIQTLVHIWISLDNSAQQITYGYCFYLNHVSPIGCRPEHSRKADLHGREARRTRRLSENCDRSEGETD